MPLGSSGTGLSKEQKQAQAANAAVADRSGLLGDYYGADQRARNQAYDLIKLYGVQGGYGTGVKNISGSTNPGLFTSPWGPSTFTDTGLTGNRNTSADYYTSDSPDIEESKLRKMLSPNDWEDILPALQSGTDASKRGALDAYLKKSGFAAGISGFSDEAINSFLKNPYTTSTVPKDISMKNFAKAGVANQIYGTKETLLDPQKYNEFVMASPAAQNMTRYVAESTQLRNREGPLYESWMRTAEKGQKERQAIASKEQARALEKTLGMSSSAVNRGSLQAKQATFDRELAANMARDWDEFQLGFTERANAMYQNAISFSNNWINDLGEFRSSTLAHRDNLLAYRQKQLELEYRNNENWMALNPKQDGSAALQIIGGIMSVAGAVLSVIPVTAPIGMGLAAGGAVVSQAGAPSGGASLDLSGPAFNAAGAAMNSDRGLFGGGTQTSTGAGYFNEDGSLKISGQPWR